LSKHLLVAGVVHVRAVPATIVACVTTVRRSVSRVCAVSGQVIRVALVVTLHAVVVVCVTTVWRGVVLVPVTVLLMVHRM
jgi:hypothetical protein